MTAHFLMSLADTLSFIFFIKEGLYLIPFMVGFFWSLSICSTSLLISSLLICMDCPVSNTPYWYYSSGMLKWVFILVLPSVPYWHIFSCWNILLSSSVPASDFCPSCNDNTFTNSVNFFSLPRYSIWCNWRVFSSISVLTEYRFVSTVVNINILKNSNNITFYWSLKKGVIFYLTM